MSGTQLEELDELHLAAFDAVLAAYRRDYARIRLLEAECQAGRAYFDAGSATCSPDQWLTLGDAYRRAREAVGPLPEEA